MRCFASRSALGVALLGCGAIASAQTPQLVKDINGTFDTSFPEMFRVFNGAAYFRANNGANGFELWRTDGTEAGTQMVLDLNPGSPNGFPTALTASNGKLYFQAYDDTTFTGSKVFVSDGTGPGTSLLVDTFPGMPGGFFGPPLPENFNALNPTTTIFTAMDPAGGLELWKTDGSPAGTERIKDIHPGQEWSVPVGLVALNGVAYFTADDSFIDNGNGTRTYNRELWRTDGTDAGTYQLKEINPGPQNSIPGDYRVFNGQVYFTAYEPDHGREIWKTDGTPDGTVRVTDIITGPASSSPEFLTPIGGKLFFTAHDPTAGRELFVHDGGSAQTQLVKDINPSGDSIPLNFTAAADKLYFSADDGTHGIELWVSDGTEAGTKIVKDINPGDVRSSPQYLTVAGDELYFVTIIPNDAEFTVQSQLWKTDGTELGTSLVWTSPGNDFGYNITNLTVLGDKLLFVAPTGVDQDGFSINYELHSLQVPEPAALGIVGFAAVVGMRRRRN